MTALKCDHQFLTFLLTVQILIRNKQHSSLLLSLQGFPGGLFLVSTWSEAKIVGFFLLETESVSTQEQNKAAQVSCPDIFLFTVH